MPLSYSKAASFSFSFRNSESDHPEDGWGHGEKSALAQILSSIPVATPHVVLGDFNEDVTGVVHSTPVNDFMTSTALYTQLVTLPTTNYGSLLDHVYVKNIAPDITCHVSDTYYSDHDLTTIYIPLASLKVNTIL
jgi:endonuclease/exonuclease/phosphatase family metal-dependent hydrolase